MRSLYTKLFSFPNHFPSQKQIMGYKTYKLRILFGLTVLFFSTGLFSQKFISIKGKVLDGATKEPLPFVSISFVGTTIGTDSDLDGNFVIESKWGSDSLLASFVGYKPMVLPVDKNAKTQTINFNMESVALLATDQQVVVRAKKLKYKRKGNPAVELIKKVIDNKKRNRIGNVDYYEYNKYEKIELDLNNITDEFRAKKGLKKIQFIFDYVDTSEMNGKPYLPFFLRETLSKVYYRKNPEAKKEYRSGVKMSNLDEWVDMRSLSTLTDILYQNVDIYENNIKLFDLQFMSPLSPLSNTFYHFRIMDTIQWKGLSVIDLAFMPANQANIGFTGHIFILNDSTTYAVVKADLGISKKINLNFVNGLQLIQEFSKMDSVWVLTKDQIVTDITLFKKGKGFFGSRTVEYWNHQFHKKREGSVYFGTEKVVEDNSIYKKDEAFWAQARPDKLSGQEEGIYHMIDTLSSVKSFRTTMDIITLLISGYKKFGIVEMGPVGSFYSFNTVEGFRLRFGGSTTPKLSQKFQIESYIAYGFGDQQGKYAASFLYTFNENFMENPRHFVRFSRQHEINFVGQDLEFVAEDNFFLSFKRGSTDKMLFFDSYKFEYLIETNGNFTFGLNYEHKKQRPRGDLLFDSFDPTDLTQMRRQADITTSEISTLIRFAPNEQYLQGRQFRMPIYNKYPVFTLNYALGINSFLGGDYTYNRLSLGIFKRFYLSLLGTAKVRVEVGKVFASGLPYFLLKLPLANQTFAYKERAFNMMNFLEFVNDEWISVMAEHDFKGFFFNKIPLLKKLKFREVITFKAIWGRLTDKNDPNKNPELIQFVRNEEGKLETFSLESKPYIEVSAGVKNIMKFFRIDVIKRLTYLDKPDQASLFGSKGLGIRGMVKFEF